MIPSYLRRIGFEGTAAVDLPTLKGLHLHHLAAIPFENLDVRLGRRVGLDRESVRAKLVGRRRGGYCFEQNGLFAEVLRDLGFAVSTLEARVRPPGSASVLPRTHMLLHVEVDGGAWLADVGFGGDGPLEPVPMDGSPSHQCDGTYRVDREAGGVHALRHLRRGTWVDLYAFGLAPALPVDFQVAHHFTSTFPESPFVRALTVQRSEPGLRRILRGRTYTRRTGEVESTRELTAMEAPDLLREEFGLDVTDDEVRAALGP